MAYYIEFAASEGARRLRGRSIHSAIREAAPQTDKLEEFPMLVLDYACIDEKCPVPLPRTWAEIPRDVNPPASSTRWAHDPAGGARTFEVPLEFDVDVENTAFPP